MRSFHLYHSIGCTVVLFCVGCGPSSLAGTAGTTTESDCGDCPNSKLLQPQVGLEQVVHPMYASWALFPLGTEVAHAHKDWEANGVVRGSTVTLKLLEKSESKVVLQEIRSNRDLSGKESRLARTINIPSALPKSAQGHEPFYPLNEQGGVFKVDGKSIEVFLARSASFGPEGERRSETFVSPSIPGLIAKKIVRDQQGQIVSEIQLICFSIGF